MNEVTERRKPLTARQRDGLSKIAAFWGEHGRLPNYREIMALVGYGSPTASSGLLRALEQKGYVQLVRKHSGESVSSYLVHGLTDQVTNIAQSYVAGLAGIKIVPGSGRRSTKNLQPETTSV